MDLSKEKKYVENSFFLVLSLLIHMLFTFLYGLDLMLFLWAELINNFCLLAEHMLLPLHAFSIISFELRT